MSEPKTLRERCEALIAGWRASAQTHERDHMSTAHAADQLADVLADDLAQGPHPESEHAVCLLTIANLQAQLATRNVSTDSTHGHPTPWLQLDSIEEPDDDAAPASAPEARQ